MRPAVILWLFAQTIVLYNLPAIMEVAGYEFGYFLHKEKMADGTLLVSVDPSKMGAKELQRILINVAFAMNFICMGWIIGVRRSRWWGCVAGGYFAIQALQGVFTGNLFRSEWVDEIGLLCCLMVTEFILRKTDAIMFKPTLNIVWHQRSR